MTRPSTRELLAGSGRLCRLLVFNASDLRLPRMFASAEEAKQAVAESRIDAVRWYAETQTCRRAELLAYFGEHYDPSCGNCDNDHRPLPWTPRGVSRSAEPPLPDSGVAVGSRVQHATSGEGLVLSADPPETVVVFDTVGYRHLTPAAITAGLLRVLPAEGEIPPDSAAPARKR